MRMLNENNMTLQPKRSGLGLDKVSLQDAGGSEGWTSQEVERRLGLCKQAEGAESLGR